ncbi:MAG: HPr family phosphocarrier protein [Candidatus Eisenbacteria bacterium]|nr:HPr family phosphocarrier protein [Candidatus Eisenbacteria bacterium]
MLRETAILANKHGLHARPAAEFVKLAGRFEADVKLTKDEITVDGKSIMGVMMLAAERGSRVTITTDGADEHEALKALRAFLETDHVED